MGVVYFTPVCTCLGVANFIFFLLQYQTSWNWQTFAFPTEGALWYQYVTSMVLHLNWQHLTNNAFCLFAFGAVLEKKIGAFGFIMIYLISGIGGNFLFSMVQDGALAIGASGAIFGIICSMVFTDPKAFVISPGTPLPLPILLFAPLYIGNEVIAMADQGSNIAHAAHVGGGIFGALVGRIWSKSPLQSNSS
jgi:membrane associated rhomboid family serine protease